MLHAWESKKKKKKKAAGCLLNAWIHSVYTVSQKVWAETIIVALFIFLSVPMVSSQLTEYLTAITCSVSSVRSACLFTSGFTILTNKWWQGANQIAWLYPLTKELVLRCIYFRF